MPLTVYGICGRRNGCLATRRRHTHPNPQPAVACSPDTDVAVLWHIAYHVPELRKWLVANPKADAPLLELVSQRGGPGVRQALEILFESMEA